MSAGQKAQSFVVRQSEPEKFGIRCQAYIWLGVIVTAITASRLEGHIYWLYFLVGFVVAVAMAILSEVIIRRVRKSHGLANIFSKPNDP